MKTQHLLVAGLFILFAGCSKKDNQPEPEPKKVLLSLNSSTALPGDIILVKSDKRNTLSSVNININSTTIKGYSIQDSSYYFIVPVLNPGIVAIEIPEIVGGNKLSLTINTYTPITNTQAVINDFVIKRNSSFDSVTKVISGSNFQPSPQSIVLFTQIKEEWDLQISKLSTADKDLLAYILQRNMPVPNQYSFSEFPVGYFGRPTGSDVGNLLVAKAKLYVTAQVVCLGSIPFLVGSGYAFVAAPNPLSGAIFLGVFTTFVISREVAVRYAEETGRLRGVADAISGADAQRPQAVEFKNNTEKALSMSVSFRNLSMADASIQADISNAFSTEQKYVTEDKVVESMYSKAAAIFSKLKGLYPTYSSIIGRRSGSSMTLAANGSEILFKSVSDSRISVSTTLSGATRKVIVTSAATTEINFNIEVAYKRSLDGKEFTKNIACLYKPEFDSTSLYAASLLGKYLKTPADPAGSSTFCTVKADGTATYTVYNNPSWPDGRAFGASWGVTKQNGRYYYSESGFWHPGFPSISVENPLTYPVSSFKFHNSTVYTKQ